MWGDVGCVRPRILEALLPGARLYRLGNHQPASSMGQDGISSLNVRTRLWDLLLQEVLKRTVDSEFTAKTATLSLSLVPPSTSHSGKPESRGR